MRKFLQLKQKIVESKQPSQQIHLHLNSITSSNYKIKPYLDTPTNSQDLTFREQLHFEEHDNQGTVKIHWQQDIQSLQHPLRKYGEAKVISNILQNLKYLEANSKLATRVQQIRNMLTQVIQPLQTLYSPTSENKHHQHQSIDLIENSQYSFNEQSQICLNKQEDLTSPINIKYVRLNAEDASPYSSLDTSRELQQSNQYITSLNGGLDYQSSLCVISERYQQQQSDANSPHDSLEYKKIIYILEGSTTKKNNKNQANNHKRCHTQFTDKNIHDSSFRSQRSIPTYGPKSVETNITSSTVSLKPTEQSKTKILHEAISLLNSKYNKKLDLIKI